jgi:hypothetical protein
MPRDFDDEVPSLSPPPSPRAHVTVTGFDFDGNEWPGIVARIDRDGHPAMVSLPRHPARSASGADQSVISSFPPSSSRASRAA